MIMSPDDYDDYDNWEVKHHARVSKNRIGSVVPSVDFKVRSRDKLEWNDVSSYDIFGNKRVIVFSLPGAFTPICSVKQLPAFEELYDTFKEKHGIDEIYCFSVNDGFTINAWFNRYNIWKVKPIPDGNATFTQKMSMLVQKENLGFGDRSWRYAMIVKNGRIEAWFEEPGFKHNSEEDPYGETSPENIMNWLDSQ
jgi:peroxiredoxin